MTGGGWLLLSRGCCFAGVSRVVLGVVVVEVVVVVVETGDRPLGDFGLGAVLWLSGVLADAGGWWVEGESWG